jgi:CTP:phosphocholine cytidylyltransferase-like protein
LARANKQSIEELPNVWVVNNSGHDFSPAYEYGEDVYYLTTGRVNIFKTNKLISEFKGKMANFKEDDWLLLSGNAILNVLAVTVALEKHGMVQTLLYNAITNNYAKTILDKETFQGGVY